MKKHKTKEEWIKLFIKYESGKWEWKYFFDTINRYKEVSTASHNNARKSQWEAFSRNRFINKYKQWKLLDNKFMEQKKKRRTNKEVNDFVRDLTREELEEIARVHIRENEKTKKKTGKYKGISITKMAFILNVHRTTLYKKGKARTNKYDYLKDVVRDVWSENRGIYGRRRLSIILERQGIYMNDRTLGRYLNRWGLLTKTRKARKKREEKNTNVKFPDLVQRNFNPINDNVVATDVSYIPAKIKQNNIYLSVAISHKTKMIESWKLSNTNNNDLVIDTLKSLRRRDFILHSDHGSQYSSDYTLSKLKHLNFRTSMSRIGNSLDNREVEYFFGCLKGEYLKHVKTHLLSPQEIKKHIAWYIDWYNTKRIQSRLQWKTPTEVSAHAI